MVAPLDDFTIAKYQLIKERYQTEYPLYYQMLLRAYPDTKQGIGKEITKALSEIEKISPLLDKVLAGRASIEEVEKLNESISKVDITQAKFAKLAETSSHFRKAIETIAETAGIPKEDMLVIRKSLEDSRKSLEKDKRRRPGPLEEIRKAAAETKRFGLLRTLGYGGAAWLGVPSIGRVVRGLLETIGSVAGPLQPLIAPTLGLTAGLGYGAWRLGRLGKQGLGRLFGKKIPPEAGRPIEETPSVGGVPSPMLPIGVGAPSPRLSIGMGVPRPGAFRSLGRRKKEELTDPLFYFFNKRAYRAAWTRDVLRALTSRKVTGKGGVLETAVGVGVGAGAGAGIGAGIGAAAMTAALGLLKWGTGLGSLFAMYQFAGEPSGPIEKAFREFTGIGELKHRWVGPSIKGKQGPVPSQRGGKKTWGEFFSELAEGVKKYTGLEMPKEEGLQKGGIVVKPTITSIAEKGPEAIIPLENFMNRLDKGFDEIIKAIQNQPQPTPASIPLRRDEIGQRSIDEDPLMDRLSRGEYHE